VPDSNLNRKVICPDGWAKTYGNPDTTPIDTSDTAEFAHCDASKVTVSCTVPKP
jgi:hypothetical protein